MKFSWKDRLRNYAFIQRSAAFLMALVVIFVFFPKEGLFKYEYQLKQPWKHDKLYAPFDFGIRKSAEEIEKEQEEIAGKQAPIFSLDKALTEEVMVGIHDAWDMNADSVHNCDRTRDLSMELVAGWLERGIVKRGEETRKLNPFDPILIEKDGKLEIVKMSDALSISEVVDSLRAVSLGVQDSVCRDRFVDFVEDHLVSNASYNDSLTQKLIENSFDKIILVEGKINKGQAIIDRGEIVNEERYKILESLRKEYAERTMSITGFQWSLVGQMAIVALLLGLLLLFVYLNQGKLYNDPRPVTLSLSLLAVGFVVCSLAYASKVVSVYVMPIGIAALLLRMFFDFRISIFSFLILVLIVALFSSNPLEFIIVQISAISFATLYQSSSTKRSRMLGTAIVVFMGYSTIYTAISIAQNGSLSGIITPYYGWFAINGLLCMMVFPLIYVVEKVFGYVSETTLLELSDSNQPLLKELAVKAPGTFQHSLQVANLAEKVASRIGGNAVLLRTAAMYHDVGKMNEPQFFIENQLPDNNPHDDLEPGESARIIINHVTKGVEKAREYKLPVDIIQFIRTHHGTTAVRFFLYQAQQHDDQLDEAPFRYPGPRPNTMEQAILMMADSVEAASRSLKKYDHDNLDKLVESIIDRQREEGQFEESPITFKDITIAKSVLQAALKGIFHQRISYE